MIIAPVMPPTPPEQPKTTIARFKKFGAYTYCELCGLELAYCKGHALPEFGSEPTSDLNKRIREARER